jgi:hypothetical protein
VALRVGRDHIEDLRSIHSPRGEVLHDLVEELCRVLHGCALRRRAFAISVTSRSKSRWHAHTALDIIQSPVGDVKFCVYFRLCAPFYARLAAECGNAQDQEPANQVSSLHHPDGAAIRLRTTTPSA